MANVHSFVLILVVFALAFTNFESSQNGSSTTSYAQPSGDRSFHSINVSAAWVDSHMTINRGQDFQEIELQHGLSFADRASGLNNNLNDVAAFQHSISFENSIETNDISDSQKDAAKPINNTREDARIPGAVVSLVFGVFGLLIIGRRGGGAISRSAPTIADRAPRRLAGSMQGKSTLQG